MPRSYCLTSAVANESILDGGIFNNSHDAFIAWSTLSALMLRLAPIPITIFLGLSSTSWSSICETIIASVLSNSISYELLISSSNM